uniref:FXNA-like protease n=1 Tax=Panagrellus redivivus TaxID=6233 RepID=A0A7E4V4F5_PANRE
MSKSGGGRPLGVQPWIVILVVVTGVLYFVNHAHLALPDVVEPDEANSRFSEKRAFQTVETLAKIGPKPSGSEACEESTVTHIQNELKTLKKSIEKSNNLKLDLDFQRPSGCFSVPRFDVDGFGLCYRNVSNIVARLGPRQQSLRNDGALLINCHYDSWATSPAASDDLASCAIMLELIRILGHDKATTDVTHDVIFLFNGAEEAGLLASHGFITQHGYRHPIKGFINLEASGSGGREVLFQSGPHSQWLLDAYLRAAPHPHLSVLGQEVFSSGIVPSDTDFRIFRDHGRLSGLDFAFAQNAYWWHTEFDEAHRIRPGSLQHAGDNVLAVVRLLLKEGNFGKSVTFGKPYFVFFDYLGFATIAYGVETSIVLSIIATVAVLVVIGRHVSDFRTVGLSSFDFFKAYLAAIFIYPFNWASVLFVVKCQIQILGDFFDAKMLWLAKHSVVIPFTVLPIVVYALVAFGTAILKFSPRPEARLAFTWALYDVHNLLSIAILWYSTYHGSAIGFIFLATLTPTIIDALIRLVVPSRDQTLRSTYYLSTILPFTLPAFTLVIYKAILILSVFIPILGRSKGDTDFAIVLIAIATVFLVFFYVYPLIFFTHKLTFKYILRTAFFVSVIAVVLTVVLATPYKYSYEYPVARRTQLYHVRNRVLADATGLGQPDVVDDYQQVLAIAQDNRQVGDIPFVARDKEFEEIDCTGKGQYCRLPFLYPTPDRLGPNMIRAKNVTDPSFAVPESKLVLVNKRPNGNAIRYEIAVSGTDQISVVFRPPPEGTISGWRLHGQPNFVTNSSFAFLSCSGPSCGNWWIEIFVGDVEHDSRMEIMVASHSMHGDTMKTDSLNAIESEIKEKRASGDWRWSTTTSAWAVDVIRGSF